uniref:type II toxin-antitoxin system RelE/ParE family toxin n=1 Tax=Gilliamella sp. ESL0232 TaxID=2705037 RepID=UPI001EEB2E22|nr:type II toxin-antitoxin system RelE/ParE family toxin [Gilliamella sp. ESL0232]
MITVSYTQQMEKWLKSLKDKTAAAKIKVRIRRMQEGNFGDVKPVGSGVSEMRIHCGKGYRVYFVNPIMKLLFYCVAVTRIHNKQILKLLKN